MSNSKCSTCAAPGVDGRCKPCSAVAVRITRVLSDDGKLKGVWKLQDIDKTRFYQRAQGMYGDELTKLMYAEMEEATSLKTEVTLVGNGDFLDKEDLEDKYKKKPQRLAAILKNARQIYDEVSETWLIEDMSYASSSSAS